MRRDVAIKVDRLSKTYPVYATPMDALKEVVTGRQRHTEFHALHDVSFRVRRGERVGIVGANGAGKSTLLKILAGTVDHNAGRFRIQGRLRAILELGTGFHEECTGRENILMGGLCLGYSASELEAAADWVIEFSELGKVIDRPLRTYSSGMKMRLMYSVAFCKPVEVMIIDEALATGDGAFVRKCTNHIVELCTGGTTALIVSHNLYFLERMCHRVIYLRDGRLVADGDPLEVCKQYEADLGRAFVEGSTPPVVSSFRRESDSDEAANGKARPLLGADAQEGFFDSKPIETGMLDPDAGVAAPRLDDTNGAGERLMPDGSVEPIDFSGAPAALHLGLVRLRSATLFDEHGDPVEQVACGRPCRMRFELESRLTKDDVHVGFMIWNERNEHVATTTNICSMDGLGRSNARRIDLGFGVWTIDVVFPSLRLGTGGYFLKFGISAGREHYSDDDLLMSENRCLAFHVARPDHVQQVNFEPHSVWTGLTHVGEVSPEPPAAEPPSESPSPSPEVAET